jgi:HPt (histidine-containing phosphotransfer) domain-containing protein
MTTTKKPLGRDDYLSQPIDATNILILMEKWLSADSIPVNELNSCSSTADATRPAPLGHFDKVEFMDRTMGNLHLSHEMVTMFINKAPEYVENIRNALAGQDLDSLYRSAHKLRGAAETMAMPRLSETAHLIEVAANSDDLERATSFFPELLKRLAQATKILREDFIIDHR